MRIKTIISSAVATCTLFAGTVALANPASAATLYGPYPSSNHCALARGYVSKIYPDTTKCYGSFGKNPDGTLSGGWYFKSY